MTFHYAYCTIILYCTCIINGMVTCQPSNFYSSNSYLVVFFSTLVIFPASILTHKQKIDILVGYIIHV